MEENKPKSAPFRTDLAAWGIGYISQRVKELAGIETVIVSFSCSEDGRVFEYTLNSIITIGYSRFGVVERFEVPELINGYYDELLDQYAERYIHYYQKHHNRLMEE